MIEIKTLIPVLTPRQGTIAKESGETTKGYKYFPGDIITSSQYVIDQASYTSGYTELERNGDSVVYTKNATMSAVSQADLVANIDEFNGNISQKWIDESIKAKGIAYDGRVAYINDDGKLTLVESEKVAVVPEDAVILFNIDENGRYYNVYYCPKKTVAERYTNASDII